MSRNRTSGRQVQPKAKLDAHNAPEQHITALPRREALSLLKGLPALPMDPSASQGLLGSSGSPTGAQPPTDVSSPPGTQPPMDMPGPTPTVPPDATSAAPPIDASGAANQVSTQNLDSAGSIEQASGTQETPVTVSEP